MSIHGEPLMNARRLTRKAYFVDEKAVRRARKALGVDTDAEAVRLSLERVAEMDDFWRLMDRTRGRLVPGEIESP